MDLARYVVDAVTLEGRSQRSTAEAVSRSVGWVNKQVALYRQGGYEALVPLKRGAKSHPNETSAELEDEIITIRKQLSDEGWDAGARTIHYHLRCRHSSAPAISTIHRVLKRRGFVTPQPQKRPRSSWKSFVSDLPNEMWQSDATEWSLANDVKVEIVNFVDDCSRLVLNAKAFGVLTSERVVEAFYEGAEKYGFPQSLLTDNGAIYTASYRNGRAAVETEMYSLGILVKHGKPYHPQTQGKVERFNQTLKRWLRKQPKVDSIEELQKQINKFVGYYNTQRPHGAIGMVPPFQVWNKLDKATPKLSPLELPPHARVRHDKIDKEGRFTLRHNGKIHHIGMGRKLKGTRIIVLVANLDIRVLSTDGELLRHLTLDPNKDYQPLK